MAKKSVKLNVLLCFCAFLIGATACGGTGKKINLARSKEKDLDSCLALANKKKHDSAIQCFEAYKSRHTEGLEAAQADLALADSYFAKKDFLVAAQAYTDFVTMHPYHEKAPYAYYRHGLSVLNQVPGRIDRDQSDLENAHKSLMTVINYYGSSPYAADARTADAVVQKRRAKKEYYIGRFYFKMREYLAAVPRFQTVVTEYVGAPWEDKSFYYMLKALKTTSQDELAKRYFEIYKTHHADRKDMIQKMTRLF